ncbi:lipopolysaccharide biosynthesis protein [Idiomarina baltica]|uniref:lipopolysaccharide biosynthesis protein n=1 Tax=Idiomarina baltica TaxID=190892 RepID=UPI0013EFB5AF|nr:oligosaccharide flippase family protein [Idiomarina baltica]
MQKKISIDNAKKVQKNILTLISGNLGARALGFIFLPLITRVYSPEDFGVFSLFTAVLSILLPIATLKYEVTVLIPKSSRLAFNQLVVSVLLTMVMTLIVAVILLLFRDSIFRLFDLEPLLDFWWLLPLGIFTASSYSILSMWGTRLQNFKILAITSVYQSFIGGASKLILAYLLVNPLGLLVGHVMQQGGGIYKLKNKFWPDFKCQFTKLRLNRIWFGVKLFRNVPLTRFPSQLILVLTSNSPILYSSVAYESEVTGFIGLAFTTLALPMALVGQSVGKAYFSEIAKIGRKNIVSIGKVTKFIVKRLFIIAIIPTLVLIFFGPFLFSITFGSKWAMSGEYVSILAWMLIFQFITAPIINLFTVLNKHQVFLYLNLLRLCIVATVFTTSFSLKFSPISWLTLYSVGLSAHYCFLGLYVYWTLKSQKSKG